MRVLDMSSESRAVLPRKGGTISCKKLAADWLLSSSLAAHSGGLGDLGGRAGGEGTWHSPHVRRQPRAMYGSEHTLSTSACGLVQA